jgi:hypothetical protein
MVAVPTIIMSMAAPAVTIGDLMEIALGVGCVADWRECEGWPKA